MTVAAALSARHRFIVPGSAAAISGGTLYNRALLAACRAETTTDRYINAHLGALRAAAALLATRSRRSRGRVSSVWRAMAALSCAVWAML